MRERKTLRNNKYREKKMRNRYERKEDKETERQRHRVRQRDNNAIQETTDM
jgi:hypothetical protein